MRASTPTLLSLFEWGTILGIDPFELAGFMSPIDRDRGCASVFFQYQYQQDFLSREEVASTIAAAEAAIADHLGYWPAPVYTSEMITYPRPAASWLTVPAVALPVRWAKVHGAGTFAREEISASSPVTLSDEDGDGVNETFTVTQATGVTDPEEIALYYIAADRLGAPLDETWRIRPLNVTISDGVVTITGHASLLAKPDRTHRFDVEPLDYTDAANYVTNVAVYRVYRDTTATEAAPKQGRAIWDSAARPCVYAPCEQTSRPICVVDRYTDSAQVRIAPVSTSMCAGWRNPDAVEVHYLHGVPQVNGRMDRTMAEIVARLATAWLPVEKCGCERSNRIISYWRALMNMDETGGEPRPLTIGEVDNPFGPRRGAVWAWNRVQALKHGARASVP